MFDFKSLIDALLRRGRGEENFGASPTQMMVQMPRHQALATLIEIVREISELNRNPKIKLKERMRSISYFDEKVQSITELLVAIYRGKEVVEQITPRQVLPSLLACWQEMASGYKVCLKQHAEAPSRSFAAQAEIATLRAMEYYARQATWSYVRYFDPEPRIWRNLHAMYLIAESAGFLEKPIRWHANVPQSEAISVATVYLRAMLLYVAEPARRLPEQIWQLTDWIKLWATNIRLESTLRPRNQLFAINVSEQRPPMRLRRNMVGERYRYFDTTTLADRLASEGQEARSGNFPPELGSINAAQSGATAQLLLDLAVIWSRDGQARRRRYERSMTGRAAEVAHGLNGVSKLFDGNAKINLEAAATARSGMDMVEWSLDDESNTGLGANYRARFDDPLCVGELVAIREETSKRPTVGIVRRLHKTREGKVKVGVEKLGTQPALVSLQSNDKAYPALYTQDAPQAAGNRGLLIANALYGENREYTMTASGKAYRIRLGEALEALPTYTLSSFLVLEKL